MNSIQTASLTPMMKQYFAMKEECPGAILLFRCGDFYETYGDDAVLASKVLGIVLTKRSSVAANQIPMAGVPYHAIDNYIPKLVRAGYKVALCDQLEDPKFAKGLVKRDLTELVTPGVAFDEQMLDQKRNNFLAGLYYEKDLCGAAFLDVSTGSFKVAQGSLDYIGTLLSNFDPKEVVVERGYEKGTKDRFGEKLYVSSVEEWAFAYESDVQRLCKQFQTDSLKGFGIGEVPKGICAAGALLVYLEQTLHPGLKNIRSISRIDPSEHVWMDRFTFRNLEVFQSSSGAQGTALIDVIDRCQSPMGSRMLRQWLTFPILDKAKLNARYDAVEYFEKDPRKLSNLRALIADLGDLERILTRAATGKILPREMLQLSRGLAQVAPIKELCSSTGCPAVDQMAGRLGDCSTLVSLLQTSLSSEPAAALGKGEVIAEGVSAELDDLRHLSSDAKDYLAAMQQRETERTGIANLKISYNNVFGYYIEVRNTQKDKVPAEWVRKQTLVGAERYVTEELKEYEEKILSAQDRIYALECEIYRSLVVEIQRNIPLIQTNSNILARLDIVSGFADLALDRNYCRPLIDDSNIIDIKAGRHAVIEALMPSGEEYVPNDLYLDSDKQQIIILTGPNMSGKSALLRQSAIIVLLAQIGCFVPADSARIGICDKIFTRVGASDNISRGESTFMVEMLETSQILHNLSSRSLVLLDEIGRGTSTYDGMSIARGIVEYIHEYGFGAKTLFATHYHELNDMEAVYPRVKNFHIAVKESGKKVIFLRKLCEGGIEKSFGIHVARMAGMPVEVLASAEKTLKALESPAVSKPPIKPHNTPAGRVEADGSLQLSIFQLDDPLLENLRDDLKGADLENMTPRQALDLLYDMKAKMGL